MEEEEASLAFTELTIDENGPEAPEAPRSMLAPIMNVFSRSPPRPRPDAAAAAPIPAAAAAAAAVPNFVGSAGVPLVPNFVGSAAAPETVHEMSMREASEPVSRTTNRGKRRVYDRLHDRVPENATPVIPRAEDEEADTKPAADPRFVPLPDDADDF